MKRLTLGAMVPVYLVVFICCITAAVFGSHAITAMSESAILKDRSKIVIDAGHGGVDGGATSCTGVLESKINLEIALKLNDLFRFLGYETMMIRTTDISVYTEGESIAAKKVSDLKQRVRLVNETPNALLISIHQNYFSQNQYKGAQVFYTNSNGSIELAKELQSQIVCTINKGSNRHAKSASGIYLMEHITAPGILIECGFLSNPEEEALLRNSKYQNYLCCVVASSVGLFLDR